MSPALITERGALARFPRVSGDEPGAGKLTTQDWKFSPRERG